METPDQAAAHHPPEANRETAEEYRRVRQLLLGGEQKQLNLLHHRLQEVQQRQHRLNERCRAIHANEVELERRITALVRHGEEFVERNLAAALHRRSAHRESRNELVQALKVPVEESLRQRLAEDPVTLGEALEPAVKPEVSRGLKEVLEDSGLLKLVRFRQDGSPRLSWPAAIVTSLVLIALTGWLVYTIRENLKLGKAVSALRAEPGIVISAAGNPAFGKPGITGLHDPLAPPAGEILESAGVNPADFAIDLRPFLSANTTYAHQREQERVRELEAFRRQVIDAVGGLNSANEATRTRDLETITRALFALQFPDASGKVTMEFEDGRWLLNGSVEEPLYTRLTEHSAEFALTGEVDVSGVENTTGQTLLRLTSEIGTTQLTYLPGTAELSAEGLRQGERLVGLIGELDGVTEKAGRAGLLFEVHAFPEAGESEFNEDLALNRIRATENLLINQAGIAPERILPAVPNTGEQPGGGVGTCIRAIDPADMIAGDPEN